MRRLNEDAGVDVGVTSVAGVAAKVSTSDGVGRFSSELLAHCGATFRRYGHRRACVAAGGRRTRDEGVIWKGDPGDFYMKVIAKKFRGVWHYGVITGVVTEWVLEDYGGATQWRAVFEDGSGKVTVQSGWVMEDCLHHMETFSILNAGPLLEEARVKAIMTEKELRVPRRWTRSLGRGGLDTPRGAKARRPGQRGAKARRPGQRGAKARRPGQRGAKARRPGQRGAKARRPGQRGAKARRPGQRGAKARRPGQRGAKARRPGQRGAKTAAAGAARRQDSGGRGSAAPRQRRPGQRGAKTAAAGAARRQGAAAGAARRQGAAAGAARRQGAAAGAARRQGAAAGAARRQGAAAGAARRQGAAAGAARRQGAAAGAARL
eukprot:jgi/Tetstr1/423716/TSEL_014349.t1